MIKYCVCDPQPREWFMTNPLLCMTCHLPQKPKEPEECGYCGGTGEVACSSTNYMSCPACSKKGEVL